MNSFTSLKILDGIVGFDPRMNVMYVQLFVHRLYSVHAIQR
jgi:hypothetical protein